MKKIFALGAAVMAAMTMSAAVTNMTCAQAATAALALQEGATGTDSVAVTGYVTNTNGTLSKGQQTFYIDDVKGTAQTVQGYWCNMPAGEAALNVGDKVTIKGFLMHYVKNETHTPEIKNGDVVILERVQVNFDTVSVTVCEAIEEALSLNVGENTLDYYEVESVVTSANDVNTTYNNQTFYFSCASAASPSSASLQVYNAVLLNGNQGVAQGDTVKVRGRLMNYNNTAEMMAATILSIKKSGMTIDTLNVTVAEALAAAQALENSATSEAVYRITGYVDSIADAYNAQYKNITFYMCDDMAAPVYEFQGYRVKGGEDLTVGTKIVLTGRLNHYYKAATEDKPEVHSYQTPAGATYELVVTAVENVEVESAEKFMQNGQLYIRKNGVVYTVMGAEVK